MSDRELPKVLRPGGKPTPEVVFKKEAEQQDWDFGPPPESAVEIVIVSPRSQEGYSEALTLSGQLRERVGPDAKIETRQVPLTVAGDRLDDLCQVLSLRQPTSRSAAVDTLERVDLATAASPQYDRTRLVRERQYLTEDFESAPPPPIDWVSKGLIRAGVEGGLIAPGSTGKGLFEIALAVHLALGRDFGPFPTPRPRGVILVALEDDLDELHRRYRAAREVHLPDPTAEELELLRENFEIKSARGAGIVIDEQLVEDLIAQSEEMDVGTIFIDPLTRGLKLPDGSDLNSQTGAGHIMNLLGRLAERTGAAVIFAHHTTKFAIQMGQELDVTAATGSKQLSDLSRFMLNLKALTERQAQSCGLETDHARRRFVQLGVSKTNGPPLDPTRPHLLEIVPHGEEAATVCWVEGGHLPKAEDEAQTFLEALLDLYKDSGGEPVPLEIVDAASGMGRNRNRDARRFLEAFKLIERRHIVNEAGKKIQGLVPVTDALDKLVRILTAEAPL